MILENFFPFIVNHSLGVYMVAALLLVLTITILTNTLFPSTFIFHAFGQKTIDKEKEMIIGFGGKSPDEKIISDSNGKILNIGEINNFRSTSQGLKILVTLNNISNLLEIGNENIRENIFLKVEGSNSFSPESIYMTYKFKNTDFDGLNNYNNSKTVLFLFYHGIIEDGREFKVCIHYLNEYDKRIMCENGINDIGNKPERIVFNLPNIFNLDKSISQMNNNHNISNNKTNQFIKLNISNYDNINLRNPNSELDDSNLKFIESINKLMLIDSDNDRFNDKYYLTVINGSNLTNYTEEQISGNSVLSIDGFVFNEKNNKIYAFGDYDYLKGSDYDIKYGLAEEYHDHMIFVIDPISAKIIDSVKLWGGQEEGDESTIGNTFINYDKNELYTTALNEGELGDIFVIDLNTLDIKSIISTNNFSNKGFYGDTMFDDTDNVFYICNSDSIIGFDTYEKSIAKNFSSIYCPESFDSADQKGFFINHQDIGGGGGFIDLAKDHGYYLLIGGNITDIDFYNNTVFAVGHSTDDSHSCNYSPDKDRPTTSYILRVNTEKGDVPIIFKFKNVYIDNLVVNPNNGNLYAKTNEIISDPYSCFENPRIFNLGKVLTE